MMLAGPPLGFIQLRLSLFDVTHGCDPMATPSTSSVLQLFVSVPQPLAGGIEFGRNISLGRLRIK